MYSMYLTLQLLDEHNNNFSNNRVNYLLNNKSRTKCISVFLNITSSKVLYLKLFHFAANVY